MTEKLDQLIKAAKRSFKIYASLFLNIKTKKMQIIPFSFNRMQLRLWEWLEKDLQAGIPVRWDILKGRQLGNSTFIVLFFFWCCAMYRNRNALVVAHDINSAIELHEKCKLAYSCLPDYLKPLQKTSNRRELYFANPDPKGKLGLESKIQVDTCENQDLGASKTIQLALLSEIARYEKVRDPKIIMTSLNQSIPHAPGTAIFRETTAQGMGYWYDQWNDTESEYRKIFISWLASDEYRLEIYPHEYFAMSTEEKSLYGNEILEASFIKEELKKWYTEWDLSTEEGMRALDHEVMCRLAWRRWMITNKCEKDKNVFRQEYPTTPDQAFLGSGGAVFDSEALMNHAAAIKTNKIQPYTFRFDIEEYDKNYKDWWRKSLKGDPYGKVHVYEPPDPEKTYIIGADVGYGIVDRDLSAAHVLTYPQLEQVAVYHGVIPPDYFGYLLYALGMYYNVALVGIEQFGPGMTTIASIYHELYYPNLYYRETTPEKRTKNLLDSLGWITGPHNKAHMVNFGARIIRENNTVLRHMPTIEELKAFVKNDEDKFGAPEGKHDDLVMGLMIAYQMVNQAHIPIRKPKKPPNNKFSVKNVLKGIDFKAKQRNYGDNNLY